MIYFILNRTGQALKIGLSADPQKRQANLQSASPDHLELLGFVRGGRAEEAALHFRFRRWRLRGEWFRADPDLLQEVNALLGGSPASVESSIIDKMTRILDEEGPLAFTSRGPSWPLIKDIVRNLAIDVEVAGGLEGLQRVWWAVHAWAEKHFTRREASCIQGHLNWLFDGVGKWRS